jgi:hypothetical protein
MATGYGFDGREIVVRFPAEARDFSPQRPDQHLQARIQLVSGTLF